MVRACSATAATRFAEASDYLDVAPTVVKVATDLDIAAPGTPLGELSVSDRDAAENLAEKWNLGTSMNRIIDALDAV